MAGDKPKDALVKTKGKNTFTTLLFMYIKLHRLQEKMPALTHTKSGYLFIVRVIVYTPRGTKWKYPPNKTLGYLISFQAFKGNPCYIKILVFRENNSSTQLPSHIKVAFLFASWRMTNTCILTNKSSRYFFFLSIIHFILNITSDKVGPYCGWAPPVPVFFSGRCWWQ